MRRWMIDFDTTLALVFEEQIEKLNERFGTNYTVGTFTSWDTSKYLSPEEDEYLWEVFERPETTIDAMNRRGSLNFMNAIYRRGDEYYIVSDRPTHLRMPAEIWLEENGWGGSPLILTRSPHSRGDTDRDVPTKVEVVHGLHLDTVVEDAPHHAATLARKPWIRRVYLIDTPANRRVKPYGNKLIRVSGWEEIMEREGL